MMPLSTNVLTPNKTLNTINPLSTKLPINPKFLLSSPPSHLLNPPPYKRIAISASSASTTQTTPDLQVQEKTIPVSPSKWREFASRVSGEWDGYGAEFTSEGKPIELPESVVPEAFREWEVQVFDWQTQCPTLAAEAGDPLLTYKLIKLLPTVGCEADAATRYSIDERTVGGLENKVCAFGYDPSGSYVAVWPAETCGGRGLLEVEHCMVDPRNPEVRVRVIQVVKLEESVMRLERIRVFSEQWYGPFRNGEQLGGCAIRESGFASTSAVKESEVVGVWQSRSVVIASFQNAQTDIIHEFVEDGPQKSIRDQHGLVTLPKQLWCSLKEKEDGETWAEVGWLVDSGYAMTSRCVFLEHGRLKEMAIRQETAILEDV